MRKDFLKKTIHFSQILVLCGAAFFTSLSCSNVLVSEKASEQGNIDSGKAFTITGRISSSVNGAVPSALQDLSNGSSDSKSALPSVTVSDYNFILTDENGNAGSVDADAKTFSISLTGGSHTLTLIGYGNDGSGNYVQKTFTASTALTVSGGTVTSGDLVLELSPVTDSAKNGTVKLPVTVEKDCGVNEVVCTWTQSGSSKEQVISVDSTVDGNVCYLTMKDTTDANETVPAGKYDVNFRFFAGTGDTKRVVYGFTERVSVYSYLETNTWVNSTAAEYLSAENKIYITGTIVSRADKKIFVVSSSGSDSNSSGGYFDPFKTVQHAVDVISSINNGTDEYRILLNDTDSSTNHSTYSQDSVTGLDDLLCIEPSSTLKLSIEGGTLDAETLCRGIFIGSNAQVTLKSMTIKDGSAETSVTVDETIYSGAGIYNAGTLVLNGCVIQANTASGNGAGLYTTGSVTCTNTDFESNTTDSGRGGAVFIKNGGSFSATSGNIGKDSSTKNTAGLAGAGIYGDENTTITLNGTSIKSNVSQAYGGGIYTDGNLSLTDVTVSENLASRGGGISSSVGTLTYNSGTVSGNTATEMGGGIYVASGSLKFTGTGTISGNGCTGTGSDMGGGGIYLTGCSLDSSAASKITVDSNTASKNGGGIYVIGMGTDASPVAIENFEITNNNCSTASAQTYGLGGGLFITYISGTTPVIGAVDLENVTMSGNYGKYGGAVGIDKNCILKCGESQTVQIGKAASPNYSTANGGAIVAQPQSYVTLGTSCTIGDTDVAAAISTNDSAANYSDQAGGGIYFLGTTLTINGAGIVGNTSTTDGGGIYCSTNSVVVFNDAKIRYCYAKGNGGGFYGAAGSVPTFKSGEISYNETQGDGGGFNLTGGSSQLRFDVTDCTSVTVTGNKAGSTGYGGGFCFNGAGLGTEYINLKNFTVSGNSAGTGGGGGLALRSVTDGSTYYSYVKITGTTVVSNNTTTGSGDQVYIGVNCSYDVGETLYGSDSIIMTLD